MANLASILTDPNYVNANAATKQAIFDKFSAQDPNFTGANLATQNAIRKKFGLTAATQPEAPSKAQLSSEQIAAQAKKAAVSSWRGENPVKATVADFVSGAVSFPRAVINALSPEVANKLFPQDVVNPESGTHLVGALADPAAWATGIETARLATLLPKIANANPVVKGIVGNAAAGGVIGAPSGDAGTGALFGGLVGGAFPSISPTVDKLRNLKIEERTKNVLRDIVLPQNRQAAITLAQNAKPGITTPQALAELDNPLISKLGEHVRGIGPESVQYYAALDRSQQAARQQLLDKLARGSTSEEASASTRAFMQQAEQELGPRRRVFLAQLANSGEELTRILPTLDDIERRYILALRQTGQMATEAAQQRMLAEGARAADAQLIRNPPPGGSFPSDPHLTQPTGLPVGAYPAPGQPRFPPRYTSNAAAAEKFEVAASETADMAVQLRAAGDDLREQMSKLSAPFTAKPIRDAVMSIAGSTVNPNKRAVMDAISKELKIAGDDPVKIAEIRKLGVNQLIGELIQTGKISKGDAAAALKEIRSVIDKQLGSDMVEKYFQPYAKKLAYRDSLRAADELRQMSDDMFVKTVRGDNKDFVGQFSDTAETMTDLFGERRMKEYRKIASEIDRDMRVKASANVPAVERALQAVLESRKFTGRIPNLLSPKISLINATIKGSEYKVNAALMRKLDAAMRNPAEFVRLLQTLPPQQQIGIGKVLTDSVRTGAIAGSMNMLAPNRNIENEFVR